MAWMIALSAQQEVEDIYIGLPSRNFEGAEALQKANRRLDEAADSYKIAIRESLPDNKRRLNT
jgi:hypothetical protein